MHEEKPKSRLYLHWLSHLYIQENKGITQATLATLIGISTSFVGHIERGTRIPSLEILARVSCALDQSVDALLWGRSSIGCNLLVDAYDEMKVLNNMMRVLYKHMDEWLHYEE